MQINTAAMLRVSLKLQAQIISNQENKEFSEVYNTILSAVHTEEAEMIISLSV